MYPGITEVQLTDVSTISIPTDAILILSLLIIFALLGYFFHNILETQTNQFIAKIDNNSPLEIVKPTREDQLTIQSAIVNNESSEKTSIKRLNLLPPSKFLGIGSLALLAIGGSSLLRIQTFQNPFKGVKTSQVNFKTENQSKKSLLSMTNIKSSNLSQTKIKQISYIDPLLSANNSSKNNNFYQVKEKESEDFFSF